jgi:oligopeptide transport system substrate-binding protein
MEMVAAEMKLQWRESLGIETTFQRTTISVDPSLVPEIQAMFMGWAADYPDPDNFLHQSSIYSNLSNWGWEDSRYEEFIETAARTPDRTLRLEMYRQADRLLVAQDVLIIPVGYGNVRGSTDLVKPWIKNFHQNALGDVRFKNVIIEIDRACDE